MAGLYGAFGAGFLHLSGLTSFDDATTSFWRPYYAPNHFMTHLLSITYFVLAGLCEIGGGYLVWLWLREGRSLWYGVLGAVILILYGVIPTLQPAHFGRVYAA